MARRRNELKSRGRMRGAMLLLAIFAVAVAGILLAVAGPVWTTEMRREREAELLWVGAQYADAIGRYYDAGPAQARQYPQRLEDLLLDKRQPNTARYLRRLYRDPFTGSAEWGLVKDAGGRISGIYSLGKGVPLKQDGFDKSSGDFSGADSYVKWIFIGRPGTPAPPKDGAAPGAAAPVPAAPAQPKPASDAD